MSGRGNPIPTRLNLNRYAAWFSDAYYTNFVHQDVNFRSYFESVHCPKAQKKNWGLRLGRSFMFHFPKRTIVNLFFSQPNHRHKTRLERSRERGRGGFSRSVKRDKPLPSDSVQEHAKIRNNLLSTLGKNFGLMEAFALVELSKSKGHPNPCNGISPVVSDLMKAYKEGSKLRMVRAADLVTIPGMKKAPKKRIAALLEPTDDGPGEANGDALAESKEENNSDTEEGTADGQKLQNLQSLNSKEDGGR